MKIGVMGAGAVGCYYGAMFALAGHAVTLVGRQAFADRVVSDGLRLEKAGMQDRVAVAASTEASVLADADVIILCV